MRSAYFPRALDKRSLALSILLHALLLFLLLSIRHRSDEVPQPAAAPPLLNLDLPPERQLQPTAKLEKAAPSLGESRPKQQIAQVSHETAPSAPALSAQPVVVPPVQPVVQLPVLTPIASGTSDLGNSVTSGVVPGSSQSGGGSGSGAGAGSGGGGGGSGGDATAEKPDWIEKPTSDEHMAVLSSSAFTDHANGWAVLSCLVTRAKTVRSCKVLSESVDSAGQRRYAFGKSALRLSQYFRIRPPVRNGQPRYDIRVRIPVFWNWK
jgi:hypothetical protein